jgi:hypothetical protein
VSGQHPAHRPPPLRRFADQGGRIGHGPWHLLRSANDPPTLAAASRTKPHTSDPHSHLYRVIRIGFPHHARGCRGSYMGRHAAERGPSNDVFMATVLSALLLLCVIILALASWP